MSRKRAKKRQPYSEERRTAAMEALERNDGNFYRTARETGIADSTLYRWKRLMQADITASDIPLDRRFEHLAYQLVAALPEKLEEASLHQIIEALKFVLDKVGQVGDDEGAGVYEKLAHLINRYAASGTADGDPPPPDES